MNYKFLIKFPLFLAATVALISCDDDLSEVGGQVIDTIPGNGFTKEEVAVTAYSERIKQAEINGLPGVLLGKSQDQFDTRTYSLLSQVELSAYGQTPVDDSAVLESVVLSIPYFSLVTNVTTNSDTNVTTTTYSLDSIRNVGGKLNLSLMPSNYFLSDFDINNLENNKVYFNDEFTNMGDILIPSLNDTIILSREITISPIEKTTITPKCGETEEIITKTPPAIEIPSTDSKVLSFFNTQILQKLGSNELSNRNNFQEYFRGFYIKVNSGTDALAYLSLNQAKVTLNYTTRDETKSEECEKTVKNTLDINFRGNILNLVESDFDTSIDTNISEQERNKEVGAEKIYLKGGDGAIGVIKLFSETPQLMDELADDNVIINDALLRLYLDNTMLPDDFDGEQESLEALQSRHRIYIYNYETGEPLVDFTANPQINSDNPGTAYSNHLGLLQKEGDDYYFDIKLTQHVKNLIYNNENKENPLLGICVTSNTELPLRQTQAGIIIDQNAIKTVDNGTNGTSKIPVGSIIDPDGIVLVGNKTMNPTDPKKLKLLLTYTQPIN